MPIKANDGTIVGFFDVLDLLCYLVSDESKDTIGALYQKSATLPFQRVLDMIGKHKKVCRYEFSTKTPQICQSETRTLLFT